VTPRLIAIERLNRLPQVDFTTAIEPLFEMARPLAQALYEERPFASYEQLIDRAEAIAQHLPFEAQVAVLSAHPRIGANAATVSSLSYREQGYAAEATAGSDDLRRVYQQLGELNDAYEQRFGFRFVVFVNKRPKAEIVKVLERRLQNGRAQELAAGIEAMFAIARDRLGSLT
jgi:2-oxo-4-hydroxy-4-carboxy-5-ureidoimidazoline decarboxylase